MQRIGLFGGTFDPPHLGHLIAAERVAEVLSLERIVFIPAYHPPHKSEAGVSSADDRLAMIQLAIQDEPRFEVSGIEYERRGTSYTIDTVRTIHDGERKLFLLLGADQLRAFTSWKDYQRIASLTTLVVLARHPDAAQCEDDTIDRDVIRLTLPIIEISSSEIRDRVRADRSIRYLVPERVRAYIDAHHLYRSEA